MFSKIKFSRLFILLSLTIFLFFSNPALTLAASLQLSPATGVYTINKTFSVRVVVNSDGKPINAAEGTIKFIPQELSVISVDRSSSVFNLWVTEPTFSNSAGTINFSGGSPTGYTGSAGTVFLINFKALRAGTSRVSYSNGSVLANDGKGTNVLSNMSGGTYTLESVTAQPAPEVVEYVAPANTPIMPRITSRTHPDPLGWYTNKTAELSWTVPGDITGVRTLLDKSPGTIPTKVYETPISNITLEDLPEGESYFHLQFRNKEGWGKVANYRLAVDSVKPESVNLSLPEDVDLSSPEQILLVTTDKNGSAVKKFLVKLDEAEPFEYLDTENTGKIKLSGLTPGYHTVIVEAFDQAGNSQIGTLSFTITAFDRPEFVDFPREITEDVIPVIRGNTRPRAEVTVSVQKIGAEKSTYVIKADETGVFNFIPEGRFSLGVYEISAVAVDSFGAQSEPSETMRLAVQESGFTKTGNQIVSALSIIVPLLAMVILLVLMLWGVIFYSRRLRRRVSVESKEIEVILEKEFTNLKSGLEDTIETIVKSKRSKKLTETESSAFAGLASSFERSKSSIMKEVKDVENLVRKSENK